MSNRLRNRLRDLFSQDGFRGPVLTLLSGTGLVLAIAYLAQFVLVRLYTPDEFGVADYFVSIMVVLTSFTSLRYEDALMLPEDEKEAGGVVWVALLLLGFFAVIFSLLLPWRNDIAVLLNMPQLAPWLLFVPLTLLLMRTAKIAEWWLVRAKRFRVITASQVSNTMTMASFRIGVGLPSIHAGAGGLIGGFVLGHLVSFGVLGWTMLRRSGRVLAASFSWSRIRSAARRYNRFALYSTPSALLSALVSRLPILLIPFFFDATVVGLYGRALAVLAIPLSRMGEAVASVFFVHAAEAHRDHRLTEVSEVVHKRLVMMGLFPTLALLLSGPDVFEVVLGATWREAGEYVQYVGPWLFLASVASPLTRLFDVLERQRLEFSISILMFVALVAAMIVGGNTGHVPTLFLLIGLTGAVMRILQLVILLRLAQASLLTALQAYGRYLLFSLPGLLLIGGALLLHNAWITTIATALAGMIYGMIVLWKDRLLSQRRDA